MWKASANTSRGGEESFDPFVCVTIAHRGAAIVSIDSIRREIAREAKAIVALAFRNGPVEDLHAGQPCPRCSGRAGFSRITETEMKAIMKNAVNHVYQLLVLREENPVEYEARIRFGERYTANWDKPQMPRRCRGLAPSTGQKSDG